MLSSGLPFDWNSKSIAWQRIVGICIFVGKNTIGGTPQKIVRVLNPRRNQQPAWFVATNKSLEVYDLFFVL